MRSVLGIDAAWTTTQPSGVALAVETDRGWVLKAVAASYDHFLAIAAGNLPDGAPKGSTVTAVELVDAAWALCGQKPDLVAIDMPLALTPITGRRGADTQISRAYGAKWCSAHSPSAARPGPISDRLRSEFSELGYGLCIETVATPGLMEVYPHPALVELTDEPRRLPYKFGRIRAYWPDLSPKRRLGRLVAEWDSITPVLESYLRGAEDGLGELLSSQGKDLKAREDMLDAMVCCICGIRALDGAATSYHDDVSAIWVPSADPVRQARTLLPKSPYSARADMRTELFADQLQAGAYPGLFDPSKDYSHLVKFRQDGRQGDEGEES